MIGLSRSRSLSYGSLSLGGGGGGEGPPLIPITLDEEGRPGPLETLSTSIGAKGVAPPLRPSSFNITGGGGPPLNGCTLPCGESGIGAPPELGGGTGAGASSLDDSLRNIDLCG